MKQTQTLTQQYIKSLFTYKGGHLYWKVQKNSRSLVGDKAGSLMSNGYYRVGIKNKQYRNHRLIFLYHYGYLPKMIDHIDGDKSNNRIENLRCVTNQQNMINSKKQNNYSSQYKSVCWNKLKNKWQAQIRFDGKLKHLGYFKSEINAAKAYNKKAIELFGEYTKLNEVK